MNKTTLTFAFLSFVLSLSGCGTGDYEARLDAAASGASANSKFTAALNPETVIPGTSISMSLPKAMQATDINDPIRGKCLKLDLQGLKATYEGAVGDDPNNKWHYYLYICVNELPPSGELPLQNLLNRLGADFPNASDSSGALEKNYTVETPQGTSLIWEEFHFKCEQPFFYPKADKPQNIMTTDGVLVFLSRKEGNMSVTLVYRYPFKLADRHEVDFNPDWINLVAGTVKASSGG